MPVLNPKEASFYHNRGHAKLLLQEYKEAVSDFSEAIYLDPTDANSYFERGLIRYDFGDKREACKDWSKAGELGNTKAYEMIKQYCGN